jgi:hypothetical protein
MVVEYSTQQEVAVMNTLSWDVMFSVAEIVA